MSLSTKLGQLSNCVRNVLREPRESVRRLARMHELSERERGASFVRQFESSRSSPIRESGAGGCAHNDSRNPLRDYYDARDEGLGLFKWLHYLEIYHRHLQKFVGRQAAVVEIGVYSGGSLSMWRNYFGEGCRIHGVDIMESCRKYQDSHTTIHLGDQADRSFWKQFRQSVPDVDVLIDDGGHTPEQQTVSLVEMLPHLRPGGVYICEDIHGIGNQFAEFAHSLGDALNSRELVPSEGLLSNATPFQSAIHSIHLYPFMVVIEKREIAVTHFSAVRRGTEWLP